MAAKKKETKQKTTTTKKKESVINIPSSTNNSTKTYNCIAYSYTHYPSYGSTVKSNKI